MEIMKIADHLTIGRLRKQVFKEYNKDNKYSYNLQKGNILQHMSVNEFKSYKTKHKSYYFPLVMMMELQQVDSENRCCEVFIESEDFSLELEVTENDVTGFFSVLRFDGNYNEEELSEGQKEVLIDWFKGYMERSDEEAGDWTGDPWKDNGMKMSDFI